MRCCLAAFALALAHSGLAAPPNTLQPPGAPSASEKYLEWRAAAARVLESRGDADSLASAAALKFAAPKMESEAAAARSAAVELAGKANELDPQNACIGWLRLQLCANTPGCDIRDAATTMRWVDADNGAAWIPTLAAAEKDKDTIEVDRIVADMTQGVRFDLYWNRTVVLLFDTLSKARGSLPVKYLPSDVARLTEAVGVAGNLVIPPLTPVLRACREPAGPERREACLKLAKVMQRGDTAIVQMAGFGLERRLSPPDGREVRAVAERRRTLEYRVTSASEIDEPLLPWLKNARARQLIVAMRALPREEDVDIAILRRHRRPLEPPGARP